MTEAKECYVCSGSQLPSVMAVTIFCNSMDYCMSAAGRRHEQRAWLDSEPSKRWIPSSTSHQAPGCLLHGII